MPGCCSQKTDGRLSVSQKDINDGLALLIEYSGGMTLSLKGSVTGKSYVFSGLERIQRVDPRDAVMILHNRHFKLKGIIRG